MNRLSARFIRSLILAAVCLALMTAARPLAAQLPGYPAPRYQTVAKLTSVEQLLPYARFIVSKKGDKTVVMRPGYNIQGGEKVLLILTAKADPLVVEAFRRAFEEKNCIVDIVQLGAPKTGYMAEPINGADEVRVFANWKLEGYLLFGGGDSNMNWFNEMIKTRKYDLIVGPSGSVGDNYSLNAERMNWFTREMLASPGTTFPEEVLNLIDRKGWEIIRQAKTARYTDPEGTDISWTWFPEYWQVVEGTHPHVKTVGGGPGSGVSGYAYGRGASEDPLIPGHLMGVPEGIVLDKSDARGVIGGTTNHMGPFPHIKMYFDKSEVTKVEGGGQYGQLLREYFEKTKNIKYPLYPRAGTGFLMECAIGTNPKEVRQYNVMEASEFKFNWVDERRRSGVVHWGIGNILSENAKWAYAQDLPGGHFHIHQYFSTYEATLQNGKVVRLIEKGRLTALDDPEVRKVAAKYGNPDEMLREDWIPAIPGINVPGDYQKDYGADPAGYITGEHRKAYADAIGYYKRGYKD